MSHIRLGKPIVFLATALLFLSTGAAQEKKESACRFRFAVAERTRLDRRGEWPEDARKWWSEEGKRKFPELCEVDSQDTDFVIAWLRKQSTEKYSQPKPDAWLYGRLPSHPVDSCGTGPDDKLIICTPQPASIAESSSLPGWEDLERQEERISIAICRVRTGQFEPVASVTKIGYVPTDRPGRTSFKSAMRALKKKVGTTRRSSGFLAAICRP